MAKVDFFFETNVRKVQKAVKTFQKQYINQNIARAMGAGMRNVVKPQLTRSYMSGRPQKITGALAKSVGHKYGKKKGRKGSTNFWAMAGARTGRARVYRVKKENLLGIERHFARGHEGKMSKEFKKHWQTTKSDYTRSTAYFKSSTKTGKKRTTYYVKRDPSRYAHLIEKGHAMPRGARADAFHSVRNTFRKTRRKYERFMIKDLKSRAKKAAARAAARSRGK